MRTPSKCALVIAACLCLVAVPLIAFATCYLNCPLGDNMNSPACPSYRSPDFDGNSVVNLVDLATFASHYPPAPFAMCCDLDCNGIIGLQDLALFALHYGHVGPFPGVCF